MNLDQQLQMLVNEAPQDGSTPQLIESIAPVLRAIAQRLRHLQYYVVQTLDQNWVMLTLNHRAQDEPEKNVIYAFPSLKDVSSSPYDLTDPNLIALPVPVIHILFQMLAMDKDYSTIFFETPGDATIGTEVQRSELEALIHEYWQGQADAVTHIPSDIA
ncbi:hypothetical protein [Leptolyngbya sp. FACHB-17]|uniref:hypothetical protein n=1 Tax=unclassified Leptolyngbya TaxID=2650499 RepID=UPI0016813883|nr:hypothetical protein [Leptolyngbya sp. FACHB-17]MBD2079518.1 hypothetical protein [Leptolyngbya sp. FACHB-17]